MQKPPFLTPPFLLWAIVFFSSIALSASYVGENFFGLKPCILCLYQRYLFIATIVVAILGTRFSKTHNQTSMIFISSGLFLGNCATAIYQVLIEKKIIEMPSLCRGIEIKTQGQTFAQFQESLSKAGDHIPCDQVSFELFGVSMAGYNALFTLFLALACFISAWQHLQQRKCDRHDS